MTTPATSQKTQNFLSAKEAAKLVGYTSDYVTRLAREGKVAAKKIGTRWHVEPESLKLFELDARREKQERQRSLRTSRRQELAAARSVLVADVMENESEDPIRHSSLTSAMQAVVVVGCGIFAAAAFHLSPIAFDSVNHVAGGFITLRESEGPLQQNNQDVPAANDALDTTGPTVAKTASSTTQNGLVLLEEGATVSDVEAVRAYFSDEVDVDFESVDSGMITPIFRERASTSYRFLLVPVKNNQPGG